MLLRVENLTNVTNQFNFALFQVSEDVTLEKSYD